MKRIKYIKLRIKCALLTASIVCQIAAIWAADVWRSRKTPRG